MKFKMASPVLLFALFTSHAVAQQPSDEVAIKSVFKTFADDWNAPGFPGLESLLTSDVDFVVVTGKWLKGKSDVVAYHRELLRSFYAGSHLTVEDVSVRLVDASHAVVHIASSVDYAQRGEGVHRPSLATATLLKSSDGWKIDTFHNTITGGPGYMFQPPKAAAPHN